MRIPKIPGNYIHNKVLDLLDKHYKDFKSADSFVDEIYGFSPETFYLASHFDIQAPSESSVRLLEDILLHVIDYEKDGDFSCHPFRGNGIVTADSNSDHKMGLCVDVRPPAVEIELEYRSPQLSIEERHYSPDSNHWKSLVSPVSPSMQNLDTQNELSVFRSDDQTVLVVKTVNPSSKVKCLTICFFDPKNFHAVFEAGKLAFTKNTLALILANNGGNLDELEEALRDIKKLPALRPQVVNQEINSMIPDETVLTRRKRGLI